MKGGGVGLDGRPRPVPLAHSLEEHDRLPSAGDHQGPPSRIPTTLAPTDVDGLIRRLMRITADLSALSMVRYPDEKG